MDEQSTGVNETAEVQESATTESPAEETTELEVVTEGPELDPNDYREEQEVSNEEETEGEQSDDDSTEESEDEQTDETESEEQPRKGKDAQSRIRELANQNRELKEYIQKQVYEKYPRQEVQQSDDGSNDIRSEMDALKQDVLLDRYVSELTDINVSVNQEADAVARDFDYMNPENESRSAEDIELANMITDAWRRGSGIQIDENGLVTRPPSVPLYEFVQQIDGIVNSKAQRVARESEVKGQKAAEKKLAAVEVRPSRQATRSSKDDSKLSADEYAEKYGLEKHSL